MSAPRGYYRFLDSLNWDKQKDVEINIKIDARLKYLFQEECKLEGMAMNRMINNIIAKWTIRRIKERGCIIVER